MEKNKKHASLPSDRTFFSSLARKTNKLRFARLFVSPSSFENKNFFKEVRIKIKRLTPLRRPPRLNAKVAKFGIKPIRKTSKK